MAHQQEPRSLDVVTGAFLGDRFASILEASGCKIVRGPRPRPGRPEPALVRQDWWRVLPLADFISGAVQFLLSAGDAVLFEPDEPHAMENAGPAESVSIMVAVRRAAVSGA